MQGCRLVYLPPRIADGDISLSRPGLLGIYRICQAVRQLDSDTLARLGLNRPCGLFKVLLVMTRVFKWIYLVKRGGKCLGFLGAYTWLPGVSAALTLVIWAGQDRGMGTGSRALDLAIGELSRRGICREFLVEVKEDNKRGIKFWARNGFKQIGRQNNVVIMRRVSS